MYRELPARIADIGLDLRTALDDLIETLTSISAPEAAAQVRQMLPPED
jgi:hypothetical protein